MLSVSAKELLASGVITYVATRDDKLTPEIASGMGIDIRGASELTVFLPPCAASQRTLANLRDNGLIAVTFCRPFDHNTLQVRGTVTTLRDAGPQDRCAQEIYRGGLAEQLAIVGVPRSVTRRMRFSPAVAVEFTITDVFDQSPGPKAGSRVGA